MSQTRDRIWGTLSSGELDRSAGRLHGQQSIGRKLKKRLNLFPIRLRREFIFAIGVVTFKPVFCVIVLERRQRVVGKRRSQVNQDHFHRILRTKLTAALGTAGILKYRAVVLMI